MLCIVFSIIEYYKFITTYYFVLHYSKDISVSIINNKIYIIVICMYY